jgi:hypothetical protein
MKGAEQQRVFLFSLVIHRFWGSPTLLFIWWPELFHWWLSCRSMMLTTYIHILPKLRITGAMTLLPHTPSYLTPGIIWPLCYYRWYIVAVKYVFYFPFFNFLLEHTTFRKIVLLFYRIKYRKYDPTNISNRVSLIIFILFISPTLFIK